MRSLLERGLRTKRTVALNRAEDRELTELLTTGGFASSGALARSPARCVRGSTAL